MHFKILHLVLLPMTFQTNKILYTRIIYNISNQIIKLPAALWVLISARFAYVKRTLSFTTQHHLNSFVFSPYQVETVFYFNNAYRQVTWGTAIVCGPTGLDVYLSSSITLNGYTVFFSFIIHQLAYIWSPYQNVFDFRDPFQVIIVEICDSSIFSLLLPFIIA